jgi:hypothetical protein
VLGSPARAAAPSYLNIGYTDDFDAVLNNRFPVPSPVSGQPNQYVPISGWNQLFANHGQSGTRTIRVSVNWDNSTQPVPGDAGIQLEGKTITDENGLPRWEPSWFNNIVANAAGHNIRIIPVVFGCPSWACEPGKSYPSVDAVDDYGYFVARVARKFDSVADYMEVWNEPNGAAGGRVPHARFAAMLTESDYRLALGQAFGWYTSPNRILAGGVTMAEGSYDGDGPEVSWSTYLQRYLGASSSATYDVDIHPYDLYDYAAGGKSQAEAIQGLTTKIRNRIDEAKALVPTSRSLGITETGAPSRPPFGQSGQAQAHRNIYDLIVQRARFRTLLFYRLFNDEINPGQFDEYGAVTNPTNGEDGSNDGLGTAKSVWTSNGDLWGR